MARADFAKGEYRWVAEVMKHVVFASAPPASTDLTTPAYEEAKALLADALEQLGYQAESGPWRSVYLYGAFELRNGVPNLPSLSAASPDVIRAMPPEMLFDYLSVRLNGPKAAGKSLEFNMVFPDLIDPTWPDSDLPDPQAEFSLVVENGVLHYGARRDITPTVTLSKTVLDQIQLGTLSWGQAITETLVIIEPDTENSRKILDDFFGLLDDFEFWFNIVTP